MDIPIPYLPAKKNLHPLLDAMRRAAIPEQFTREFVADLGFTSSNDRAIIKVLRYIGMLDSSNRPTDRYREFMDHSRAKAVLANSLRSAYDDLFKSNTTAHTKTASDLKGWFKSKTGEGDAVAEKIAMTFKSLCDYADFSAPIDTTKSGGEEPPSPPASQTKQQVTASPEMREHVQDEKKSISFPMVYRLEVHLPDTQNVETFRAIFKAMREELWQ